MTSEQSDDPLWLEWMRTRRAAWSTAHTAGEKPVPPLSDKSAFEEWVIEYAFHYGEYEQATLVVREIARQRGWPEPESLGMP